MKKEHTLRRISHGLIQGLLAIILLLLPFTAIQAANTPATTPAATTTQATSTIAAPSGSFIALTQLPGLSDIGASKSLPNFFNSIYKICIGAGAVLAVLMIMIGGGQIMISQGSVSSNEKAKSRIRNAIIGLVLILSPTIVFGIINPDILKLNLDLGGLKPSNLSSNTDTTPVAGQFTGADAVLWEHTGDSAVDAKKCTESGGTIAYGCKKKDGSEGRFIDANSVCNSDEEKLNICKPTTNQPQSQTQCKEQYPTIQSFAITSANVCNASTGSVAVAHGCCVGQPASGYLCCARNQADTTKEQVRQASAKVDTAITSCKLNPSDLQKTCIHTAEDRVLNTDVSCVAASSQNVDALLVCHTKSINDTRTVIKTCISGITTAQLDCIQQKLGGAK